MNRDRQIQIARNPFIRDLPATPGHAVTPSVTRGWIEAGLRCHSWPGRCSCARVPALNELGHRDDGCRLPARAGRRATHSPRAMLSSHMPTTTMSKARPVGGSPVTR